MKSDIRLLSAALLLALAPVAGAQTAGEVDAQVSTLDATASNRGQTQVATRIAASFTSLAGSTDNALALVNALRNGTAVTLTSTGTTTTGTTGTTTTGTTPTATGTTPTTSTGTTITPPTGKMGWGNVFISLALAKTALANAGITNPTPDQLQAALTGGTVTKADGTTVTLKGVLEMRAEGMGWGQIAQAEGTKLGPVVSSIKSARVKVASVPTTGSTTTTATTTKASAATTRGITTAAGSTTAGSGAKGHKGIVTATGSGSTLSGSAHGSKGITTASGSAAGATSRGIVTAEGALGGSASGRGNAYGRGLVTAAGGGSLAPAQTGTSHGGGVVTASGTSAAGITTAQGAGGNAGGNGKGHGNGKGGG